MGEVYEIVLRERNDSNFAVFEVSGDTDLVQLYVLIKDMLYDHHFVSKEDDFE